MDDSNSLFCPAPLASAPHAGQCEVLRLSEGKMWSSGADGRLACSSYEGEKWHRNWAQRISKLSTEIPLVAISSDGSLLAVAEDTDAGFQVWVHQMEKGRMNTTSQKPRSAGRFTLPIRQLSWHQTLHYLCICTDDGKLDVWWEDTVKGTASRRQLLRGEGELGGVRAAVLDPQLKCLAAAFTSGQLLVLSFPEASEQFRATLWPKAVGSSGDTLRLAWQPDGQRLGLPGSTSIRLLPRDLSGMKELKNGHRYSSTMVAWSASGDVMASASPEAVVLWTDDCLQRIFEFTAQPMSFAWDGNFLAVGTEGGYIARLCTALEKEESNDKDKEDAANAEVNESQVEETIEDAKDNSQPAEQEETQPVEPLFCKPPVQQTFQPGATRRGRRRILAWNEHGSLKLVIPSSTKQRYVEVTYFKCRDPTSGRELKVESVEMGSLGPGILAVASLNHVMVHMATPWNRSSFEHHLSFGERIEALAVSKSFVAVFVAPFRFLRLFTPAFIPIAVLAMPMDIVSMVAWEQVLFCVFSARSKNKKELSLYCTLFDVEKQEKLSSGRLPLSPHATLRWIGFDRSSPLTLDSAGVLRAMTAPGWTMAVTAYSWVPVAEMDEKCTLWPVWAEAGVLRCMEVGPGEEPKVTAQRLTTVNYKLPIHLDGLDADVVAGAFLKHFMASNNDAAIAHKGPVPQKSRRTDSLVRLFEETVKMKDQELAFDIAQRYLSRTQQNLAQSFAQKAELNDLAKRLGETLEAKVALPQKRKHM